MGSRRAGRTASRLRWVLVKLGSIVFVLFAVTLVVQLLAELVPGDPAVTIAGELASPEQVDVVREQLGLDEPLLERYADYVGNVVQGDLGTSLTRGVEVRTSLAETLPVTMSLVLISMLVAVIVGIPAGVIAGQRQHGLFDRALSTLTAAVIAVPNFVMAFLLLVPLALQARIFPAGGYVPLADGLWEWLYHLMLPSLAMAAVAAGEVARQTRAAMADALEQDYIRTARAAGLRQRTIVGRRALKNAATPIVTVVGVQMPRLVGAAVVVENVFALPGIGTLAVNSVLQNDLPVMQGLVIVIALVMVVTNLVVDLSYGLFNPQMRELAK